MPMRGRELAMLDEEEWARHQIRADVGMVDLTADGPPERRDRYLRGPESGERRQWVVAALGPAS